MKDANQVTLRNGDTVDVLAPQDGDTHKTEFQGIITNIDEEKQVVTVEDQDGNSFELDDIMVTLSDEDAELRIEEEEIEDYKAMKRSQN